MKIRTMVKTIVMPDLFSMLCKKRKVHIWFVRFVVCLLVGYTFTVQNWSKLRKPNISFPFGRKWFEFQKFSGLSFRNVTVFRFLVGGGSEISRICGTLFL